MFTDNFRIWRAFAFSNTAVTPIVRQLPAPINATVVSGTEVTPYSYVLCSTAAFANLYANIKNSLVAFGSDDTPATVRDFSLKAPFSLTAEVTSTTTGTVEFKNHRTVITVNATAQNIGSSSVTIKELAWLRYMSLSNTVNATSGTTLPVVMARHVLDEPVTLEVGETHDFRLTIVI